ncbi:restriction endonuclease subunit S [Bizionia sp. M204]|uniref:restriction endonuclease subunit S n=1 Tax=Bizionia sp. M204 TaxID=2675331 RepID=UPI002066A81B|nr:restriction endonuclease subunit S [Bizionia sp. M204]UPS91398.1 restriction endonuclease subunit S [Bizionia sp. M204]
MKLLQHFKELTVRPKNAQELKGLILQLAIQGKLTANWRAENPDVEPASELLKRIQKEKEQLVKDKKIKKEKVLPKLIEEEIPYRVPESWMFTRLGIYTHNFGQKTPDRNFEYIDVASIDNQLGIIKSDLNILNPDEAPSRARKIVQKGCVIYSTVRPYLLNIACVDRDFENEAIASTAFSILNPILGCSPFYLYHLLRSFYFVDYVDTFSKGVAYPAINDKNLLNAPIPIPPLEEQKVIVKVVKTLFKEVEQLEQLTVERIGLKEDFVTSALNQLTTNKANQEWTFLQDHFKSFFNETTNIKKLRETVLQLAVQGKLTADWRSCHPEQSEGSHHASNLLKRIQEEKAQLIKDKKIKKEKALPKITKEEIPYDLPEGWVWCRLGHTLLYSDSGKSPNCEKRPVINEEWGVLTTTAVQQNKFIENANKVLPTNYEINPKQIVQVGDILITRAGPINRTGIACKVDRLQFNLILSDKTIRLKYIEESLFPDFIVLTLNSASIRKLLLNKMIGMASSQVNISQANIKGICFPFPPLEEQKAIVEKVNGLMGLCDALEQEVQQSQEHSEMLMQSCLREVFEGEKVEEKI